MILVFLFVIALLSVAPASGANLVFEPNEMIAASDGARAERPRVCFTDDGASHVVWVRGPNGAEGTFVVSAPPGGAYGPAVMLTEHMDGVASGGGYGPTLRANGSFLAAGWEDRVQVNRGSWVARSTDTGTSWEPAQRADPQVEGLRSYQAVAVSPDGRLSQSWMRFEPGYQNPGFDWTIQDPTEFRVPIEATAIALGQVCECCYHDQIILDDGQTILLAFRNNIDDLREIHVVRSTDGGLTFDEDHRVDTTGWMIAGCPSTGPGIAADGSTVLVCWVSAGTGITHIYSARSLDGGASWDAPLQVDDRIVSTAINFPQAAIRGNLAVVAWQGPGIGDGVPGIFASVSFDGGTAWGEPTLVSDDATTADKVQASVAIAPYQEVEIVWRDSRLGVKRIFRTRGRIDPAGLPDGAVTHGSVLSAPFPNPTIDVTSIGFSLPEPRSIRLSILDAAGRRVALLADRLYPAGTSVVRWNGLDRLGRETPSGTYFVTLATEGSREVRKILRLR